MKKRNLCIGVLGFLVLQACSDESTNFSGKQGGTEFIQGSDAVSETGETVGEGTGTEEGTPPIDGSEGPVASGESPDGLIPSELDPSAIANMPPSESEETSIDGVKNDGNGTEFGSDAVFRVGDGAADASSCKTDVDSFAVSGSEYSFMFRVEEDGTTMNFYVSRLCGIDIASGNVIALVNLANQQAVASLNLPMKVYSPGDVALEPFSQAVTLDKGLYSIRVISNPNAQNNNDRDDFLIGNIKIVANKPVVGTGIVTK